MLAVQLAAFSQRLFSLFCLGLFFHFPQAHYLCGRILEAQGLLMDAVRSYETAVAQNALLPQAFRRLAHIYRTLPIDPSQGREYLQKALTARARVRELRRGKDKQDQNDPKESVRW